MPWKMAEDGKVEVGESGNPLFVNGEGQAPVEVDWTTALSTINKLNNESQSKREAAEALANENKALKDSLSAWDGLTPELARKDRKTMESIDQKELLKADEVEKFKNSILTAAKAEKDTAVNALTMKLDEVTKIAQEKESKLDEMILTNSFADSKFVQSLVPPSDMIINTFSSYFRIEDGNIVGYAGDDKIASREHPGEIAKFDEAIKILVEDYPHKDLILPGVSGGSGSKGGGGSGLFKLTTEQIRNMPQQEYEQAVKDGRF